MSTNRLVSAPAKSSSGEKKIDAGIRRAYKSYGSDFQSFFAAVLAEIAQRREQQSTPQDTRFIKARETR
jgi:hypothetical protein